MKKIIMLLLLLPCLAGAQSSPQSTLLSVPGVADAVAQYAKQAKAVGFTNFHGKLGTGAVLPIRTLHDGEGIGYAMFGIGGAISEGEHFKAKITTMFDLSSITRRTENKWGWYYAHVTKQKLPDFWIGPNLDIPEPGEKVTWRDFGNITTWAEYAGISIAVGF